MKNIIKKIYLCVVFIALASCLSRLVHAAGNEIRLEDMANLNLIENGGGAPRKDRATSDHPLQMGGRIYEHGLGLHAPAVAMFSLDGKTEKFHTLLGFSDFPGDRGSIEFILTGDGKVLYRSGVMKGGLYKNDAVTIAAEAPKVVDVSLLGVKKLKIEVTDGGDNKYGDHVNLVDAAFTWNGIQPRIIEVEEYVGHTFPPVGDDKAKSPVQALSNPWIGKWIGPEKAEANTWICYRKSFKVDRPPSTAPARIAVDSKYWLWINGTLVVREGGLKRGPTPNDGYYDEIELAPYLKRGDNTIAVLAWYFGKHGFSHKNSGKAGLVMEVKIEKDVLVSDGTWKMLIHPAFGTAGEPKPNYRLSESSILFDASKDIGKWMDSSYDDASWTAPLEAGTPPVAPWGDLVQRPIPQWKDYGLKAYTNAAALPSVSDGKVIKARLPYNAQVTPYFKIEATAGQKIDIRTDNINGGGESNVHAEYITRDGVQEYETPGWMNGHDIEYTIPAGIKILSLQFRESGYNAEFAGSFRCEDSFYNSLWEKSKRTLYVTMRDNYMDCPDRERAQWWGDVVNELGEAFYVFDPPGYQLARKSILELAKWQRGDKTMYSPVPSGNWAAELPPQMLASVGKYGFWLYYFYTGDVATIREVYPHVRDYLTVWKLDEDCLVIHRKGDWDWSDWGSNIDVKLLDSVWYHLALQGAIEMAKLCGAESDLPAWQARLKAVENGINTKLWNGKEYRSPGYTGDTDDRGNGLAVVAGIAGPDKYTALRDVLDKHRNASPYMEKYVLEALFIMGEAQLGLDRMKQRYDGMVKRPISTLAENMDGSGTYNHAWSGGPLTIMSQYVSGVAPDKVAYERYHVLPQMGDLTTTESVVPTVKGNIQLSLKREAASFGLKLVSPKDTKAVVGLPQEKGRNIVSVVLNGNTVWKKGKAGTPVHGVVCMGEDKKYCRFEVPPGTWSFSALYDGVSSLPIPLTPAQLAEFPLKLSEIRVRDPFILTDQKTNSYYLYAQCGNRLLNDNLGTGVEVYRSKDLINWAKPVQVFERPTSNFWGGKEVWAPEVHRMGDSYLMFVSFPGRQGGRGTQILKAQLPDGPFLIAGENANTPPEQRALDGTPWVDADGTNWLLYCHEWCQAIDGAVRAVRMNGDWTARQGESILLFKASEAPWVRAYSEKNYVTDGPFPYRTKDGKLLMIWSSFRKGGDYAVGVARSESGKIEGPWIQSGEPLFPDNGGHGMFFRDLSGNLRLVLHQPNQMPHERVKFIKMIEVDGRLEMEK
jgi:hypothetical protein